MFITDRRQKKNFSHYQDDVLRGFTKLNQICILCLALTGCAVIKDTPNEGITLLRNPDVGKLNGRFANYGTVLNQVVIKKLTPWEFEPVSLWSQIKGNKQLDDSSVIAQQSVTFKFVSNRKATVKLWENGKVKERKKIRGRIKDGYFYRRPYFVTVPLIPLVFKYKTFRYRIGLADNAVIVDYRWNEGGAAIVPSVYGGKGQSKSKYERK